MDNECLFKTSGWVREKTVVTGALRAPSFLISNLGNTYREVQQRSGERALQAGFSH